MSVASLVTIGLAVIALTVSSVVLHIALPLLLAVALCLVVLARLIADYQDHQ